MLGPAGPSVRPQRRRWGAQISFVQPTEPAYWLYLVLLAIGGFLFALIQLGMVIIGNTFLLAWALLLVYALPVAALIYMLDLFEREPKSMILAAIVWGGVIAVPFAALADSSWLSILGKVAPQAARDWGPAIVAPPIEEPLKLLGVVTLYLIAKQEFDGPLDGFIYGAMVGLGFTVIEDLAYFMLAAAVAPSASDQVGSVFELFVIRVVASGLYGHVLYTGLAAIGFAYLVTRTQARMVKRLAVFLIGIGAALAGHFFWNSPLLQEIVDIRPGAALNPLQWIQYGALKGGPFLILLVIMVVFATRSEEATFRAVIAGETESDIITEREIRSLRSLLARRLARIKARRRGGSAAGRLVGRLQKAQIDYALARSRADTIADPAVEAQRVKIRAIRAQLAAVAAGLTHFADPSASPWHVVAAGGGIAFDRPDAWGRPMANLPAGLPLAVEWQAGPWVRVRPQSGPTMWVDARTLVKPS